MSTTATRMMFRSSWVIISITTIITLFMLDLCRKKSHRYLIDFLRVKVEKMNFAFRRTLLSPTRGERLESARGKRETSRRLNLSVKVNLNDLSYTLSERRTHHFNRVYVVTKNTSFSESDFFFGKKSTESPRLGFVFTGQGAQWSQMGKELCETFPVATLLFKHLDDVLQSTPNPPPWSLYSKLSLQPLI